MNLIELFESKPFQDVGTFNAIFKTTPILGHSSETSVEIKELVSGGNRRVLVNGEALFLDLTQASPLEKFQPKNKVRIAKQKKTLENKKQAKLPSIYRKLKAGEFMIYSAIKELGEVHGVMELSRNISLTPKTIHTILPRLKELGLVRTEIAVGNSGDFLKISIDTSSNT